MSNPTHKETGWPSICNVVSSTAGNGTLITTTAGHSIVLVGAIVKGDAQAFGPDGDEVTLKAGDASGTILCHLNENSGLLPGRIVVPEGLAVYLDGDVQCTLWWYIEAL